jgi:hypothetical protein
MILGIYLGVKPDYSDVQNVESWSCMGSFGFPNMNYNIADVIPLPIICETISLGIMMRVYSVVPRGKVLAFWSK